MRSNLFYNIGALFAAAMIVCILCFTVTADSEQADTSAYAVSAKKAVINGKSGITVFKGNAKIDRGGGDYLSADQITMYRDPETDELIKTEAVGNVKMKEKDMTATCKYSIFYEKEDRIEFRGSADMMAIVDDGRNRMEAPFIMYFRTEDRMDASGLLFSVGIEAQSDLDNSVVSESLRQAFEKNEISLADDAAVSVDEANAGWLITDGDKKYIVEKEADKLNICASVGVRGRVMIEVKEDESTEEKTEKVEKQSQ